MARTCLFDASAGEITCGTVDGINLATLYAAARNHDHVLSGFTGYAPVTMNLVSASAGLLFYQASDNAGTGSGRRRAYASDTHRHPRGSLITNVETPGAGSGPTDDEITVASASGDAVADLYNTYAPDAIWGNYNGHWHTTTGNLGSFLVPALRPKYNATYKYFHTATDSTGTGATWEEVATNAGSHLHGPGNLALSVYAHGGGGGAGDAGAPKFAIRSATGNLETKRDCNGIDVSAFWTVYAAHIAHPVTGATTNKAQSNAGVHGIGTSHVYLETTLGNYELAYVVRLAHSHSGAGIIIAVPS